MIREELINTPIECGVRSLVILQAIHPRRCDLKRLVTYDYFLSHSGDVEGGPLSLHAESPFRDGEILVRREIVQRGLTLIVAKGLVQQHFGSFGVEYEAASFAGAFLNYFESAYANKAKSIALWINDHFGSMSDLELDSFVTENLGKWGIEFADNPYDSAGESE